MNFLSSFAHRTRAACAALLMLAPSASIGAEQWTATGLLGKSRNLDDSAPRSDADDISGIACAPSSAYPRLCLIVDDEARWAQIAILKDSRLVGGDRISLSRDVHKGRPVELDGEGVAFGDGAFYIAGSHGRPRREEADEDAGAANAKASASRQLFRVVLPEVDMESGRLKGEPKVSPPSTRLSDILQTNPATKAGFDAKLSQGGLSVEGIAIADARMYVGLRQPVGPGGALILSMRAAALFDDGPDDVKTFAVDLGKTSYGAARGVRDLAAQGPDLLILAGPEQNPPRYQRVETGDYSIYRYTPKTGALGFLTDIQGVGSDAKPEALAPLEEKDGRLSVLLLSDSVSQGAPRELRFDYPK